ncbi:MAG: substrate-binding domain-containing protein [Burkholderiales bacterium]|nr:substrate-binding domain-containing protein [Burkholderiales bacterium]
MKLKLFLVAAVIGGALLFVQSFTAKAAEVKVVAGVAMRPVWEDITPQFERTTGHKLVLWYGNAGTLSRRMEAGDAFDLLVAGTDSLDAYAKRGMIATDTRTEIARVGMGVTVRAGAPRPDINSVEAFKRALLDAKSVTYNAEGAVGLHLGKVFEHLGITEQMKGKNEWVERTRRATLPDGRSAGRVLQGVADGAAELGFSFTNEVPATSGVELVGPFPSELQRYSVFSAAVASGAKEPEAAKALIEFLRSPAGIAAITAGGMQPITQ